jgi:glycosyltransferase involved in cell wall biosynthesis
MKAKVCHITTVHPPFDVRIFHKECKTLAKAGYEVYLIAQHDKEEIVDGVHIIPIPKAKNRMQRITLLSIKALRNALKLKAEVYHFHDPELIFVGLTLKLFGKKVIYDVHENVPKDILAKEWIRNLFIKKAIAITFDKIERFAGKFFDEIVVAWPEIAVRFPNNKTILVSNLPDLSLTKNSQAVIVKKTKPIVIYAGGLNKFRGIKELIEAIGLLKGKVELWLLGNWQEGGYQRECESLTGWEYTRYLGYKGLKEVYSYMKSADVGVVNFLPMPHNIKSLPNKPFEYMACDLPVIMSNFTYWMEIFKDCAVFCNPKDPKDIADKINYLLEHPEKANELKQNSKEFLKKYNWEEESKKLLPIYEELVNEYSK